MLYASFSLSCCTKCLSPKHCDDTSQSLYFTKLFACVRKIAICTSWMAGVFAMINSQVACFVRLAIVSPSRCGDQNMMEHYFLALSYFVWVVCVQKVSFWSRFTHSKNQALPARSEHKHCITDFLKYLTPRHQTCWESWSVHIVQYKIC